MTLAGINSGASSLEIRFADVATIDDSVREES
jgi:hypothetical protein